MKYNIENRNWRNSLIQNESKRFQTYSNVIYNRMLKTHDIAYYSLLRIICSFIYNSTMSIYEVKSIQRLVFTYFTLFYFNWSLFSVVNHLLLLFFLSFEDERKSYYWIRGKLVRSFTISEYFRFSIWTWEIIVHFY